jgi:tetratricopeptide (TPR) repeat protein
LLACTLTTAAAEKTEPKTPFLDLVQQAQQLGGAGKWTEAADLWERIAQANPTRGEYWERLGWSRYSARDHRKAIVAFQKALDLRAGSPATMAYNLACCHALLGEKDDALRWLEKAMQQGYRFLRHARTDSDLQSLREDARYRKLLYLADVSKMSRDEGWRYDLAMLATEIRRLHYNPFRFVTREQFDEHVRKLHADIPKLKDEEITVGFMKVACLAGDGHTSIRPSGPIEMVPLQLFQFTEGVFVTAAAPEHADLVGAKILSVGKHSTAEALAALDPVIHRDNAMGPKVLGPFYLTIPRLLNGAGLISEANQIPFTIRDSKGNKRTVTLTGVKQTTRHMFLLGGEKWVNARKGASRPEPLTLKNRTAPYWFEYLPEHRTVYFQFNSIRNDGKELFRDFCTRLFKFIDEKEVDRLVIDLRWNGGGNTFLVRPLLHGLVRSDKINQRGKLFVIIGRNTFSAAQNAATEIEMHTNATFVGEPTGSSPNHIGETNPITLPYSKMEGSIASLYWQRSWPMDSRKWIAPHLYAPPSFALFKENRDPALEAILEQASPKKVEADTAPTRKVTGQVLRSTVMPAVNLELKKEFKYVGGHTFILYEVARAEQHFFVDADAKGRIKRMYWIQFEGYLPGNTHTYKYKKTKSAKIGEMEFIADASAINIKASRGRPNSDGDRARQFLEKKGYRLVSDDILAQRLVHLVDKEKRNELMIIYSEDLAEKKLTAKDLAPGGRAAAQWDTISGELLKRALGGIKVVR